MIPSSTCRFFSTKNCLLISLNSVDWMEDFPWGFQGSGFRLETVFSFSWSSVVFEYLHQRDQTFTSKASLKWRSDFVLFFVGCIEWRWWWRWLWCYLLPSSGLCIGPWLSQPDQLWLWIWGGIQLPAPYIYTKEERKSFVSRIRLFIYIYRGCFLLVSSNLIIGFCCCPSPCLHLFSSCLLVQCLNVFCSHLLSLLRLMVNACLLVCIKVCLFLSC